MAVGLWLSKCHCSPGECPVRDSRKAAPAGFAPCLAATGQRTQRHHPCMNFLMNYESMNITELSLNISSFL